MNGGGGGSEAGGVLQSVLCWNGEVRRATLLPGSSFSSFGSAFAPSCVASRGVLGVSLKFTDVEGDGDSEEGEALAPHPHLPGSCDTFTQ
ncbi:hypothetical protein Hamer_G024642, partial [Homarus americanus]